MIKNNITEDKIKKYFEISSKALKKIKKGKIINVDWDEKYNDFLDMATRYYEDAKYFYEKKDYVNAFAALNYAHGWLDCGARLGLFDVGYDSVLFTVDKEMFKKKKDKN
jgi:uncharacterized protein